MRLAHSAPGLQQRSAAQPRQSCSPVSRQPVRLCREQRRMLLTTHATEQETASKTETREQQQQRPPAAGSAEAAAAAAAAEGVLGGRKSLSPASLMPGASGITVNGWSPTSMQGWTLVKEALREANVKMVSAQEVVFAKERGITIIDVRPADLYQKGHVPGAVSVPFYQPIQGWDAMKVMRRVGYAMFGVLNGTEVNPNFVRECQAVVGGGTGTGSGEEGEGGGAILYCSIGGSLDSVEGSKKGLQSRSLIAAWQLVTHGVKNVSVLKGGYSEWVGNGRDVEQQESS